MYKLKNNIKSGKPNFKIETPNSGEVKIIAGTRPINVLIKAVKIKDIIISFSFNGAINKLVKFLLQISSKKKHIKAYARSKKNVVKNCACKNYSKCIIVIITIN